MRLSAVPFVGMSLVLARASGDEMNDACKQDIEYLLSPIMKDSLAVANDASSNFNVDAFDIMSVTTGYPGQIGDYDECSKVVLFDPSPDAVGTHLCLAGSRSFNYTAATIPFGGLCVPDSCEAHHLVKEDFRHWLRMNLEALESSNSTTDTQEHYLKNLLGQIDLAVGMWQGFTCGTYKRPEIGADAWAVLGGICLLVVFVIYATLKDLVEGADYPQYGGKILAPLVSPQHIKYGGENDMYSVQEDHINKYLAAFSVPRNLTRLFTVGATTELSVFDGLRVISMLWVVLGHTLAVQASVGYINPEAVMPPNGLVSQVVGQLFFSARFSVDTFFFVSGFLVVHVMLKRFNASVVSTLKGGVGKVHKLSAWLPFFYVHRLLRITPPYLFSLLFWWKLAVFMGQGPFWYRWEYFIGLCDKFWWSNILYVNNFIPWHQGETNECFYHTWYLANDLQFYLISPFFVLTYMRSKFWGFAATAITLVASVVAMVVGTHMRGWSALTFDGAWVIQYDEETYTTPYFRIVPYVVGMMFAMFWHEKQCRFPNFKMTDLQRYICLGISVCLFSLVTFSGYTGYQNYPCPVSVTPDEQPCGSGWGIWWLSLYNAGTRPAWTLALCLLCFVCFNGQGGLIQQLLAHRGWVPMARLSFGAYLLHPLVINLWFLNTTTKFHFSKLDFCMTYLCVSTVTFGSALVMSVIIESPLTKLGKFLESSLKPRKRALKSSPGFDAAEQSPGNIDHHIRVSVDGMSSSGTSLEEDSLQPGLLSPSQASGSHRGGGRISQGGREEEMRMLNGVHDVPNREMAMLMGSNSNPDHRDYLTLGGIRNGEAFG